MMIEVNGWLGIILLVFTIASIAAAAYAIVRSSLIKTRMDLQSATIEDYEARTRILELKQVEMTAINAELTQRAAVLEQVVTGKKELADLQETVNTHHQKAFEKMEQIQQHLLVLVERGSPS